MLINSRIWRKECLRCFLQKWFSEDQFDYIGVTGLFSIHSLILGSSPTLAMTACSLVYWGPSCISTMWNRSVTMLKRAMSAQESPLARNNNTISRTDFLKHQICLLSTRMNANIARELYLDRCFHSACTIKLEKNTFQSITNNFDQKRKPTDNRRV